MKTLDKCERQFLVGKYCKSGLDFDDAVAKVNLFQDSLRKIAINFKNKGKSEKDIETKFKQEFEKLVRSLET
jgi:hypothetical protein